MSLPTPEQTRVIDAIVSHPRIASAKVIENPKGAREVFQYDVDGVLLFVTTVEPDGRHRSRAAGPLGSRCPDCRGAGETVTTTQLEAPHDATHDRI